MLTIAIASGKGGTGKSTIAAALAVRAMKHGRVALIDLNPDQPSLTHWWTLRGEPKNPCLFDDYEDLVADLPKLGAQGWRTCLIDTPPGGSAVIEMAVAAADIVLIPVKPSIFDAAAASDVVEMAKARQKLWAFVLSDIDTRFRSLNAPIADSLAGEGLVLAPRVSHLQSYAAAPNLGKTGPEIDARAAAEFDALWADIRKFAPKAVSRAATVHGCTR
jgi:chromosome partitioning protein